MPIGKELWSKLLACCIAMLMISGAFGQIHDTTLTKMDTASTNDIRIEILVDDGWVIQPNDPALSLEYALAAEKDSLLVKNLLLLDKMYRLMAFSYGDLNNRSATLACHLNRLRILSKLKEPGRELASAYFETAGLHMNMKNQDLALPCYEECLRICREIEYKTQEGQALIELADIYHSKGQSEKALGMLREAQAIFLPMKMLQFMVGFIQSNTAHIYKDLGEKDKAMSLADSAVLYIDLTKYQEFSGLILSGAGAIKLHYGDDKKAIEHLTRAKDIFEEYHKLFYLPKVYRDLSKAYKSSNMDSSYHYLNQFVWANDSVLTEENSNRIAELQIQYDDEQDRIQILELENQQALNEAKIKRDNEIMNIIIFALILVGCLAVGLIFLIRLARKRNKEVSHQKLLVEQRSEELQDSINYAKRIQGAMIPEAEVMDDIFPDSFVFYRPKEKLSGDFYWCHEVTTNSGKKFKLFAVGDCTGHGVPGALLSILGINFLNLGAVNSNVNTPGQALDYLNQGFTQSFGKSSTLIRDGMDLAMGAIDMETNKLHFSGAKNPIYVVQNGELTVLKGDPHAIGYDANQETPKFSDQSVQLNPGDAIYVASDGFQDQFGGAKGKKFKLRPFKRLIVEASKLPIEEQKVLFEHTFLDWMGDEEQIDDVCVLGVRI